MFSQHFQVMGIDQGVKIDPSDDKQQTDLGKTVI
jgi:hypothetical protein